MKTVVAVVIALGVAVISYPAPQEQTAKAKYVPRYVDPVIKQIEDSDKQEQEERDSVTSQIRDQQEKRKEAKEEGERVLRFDFTGIAKPASPEVFNSAFHFPPVAQYRTGTCWCFAGTSFLESEVARLTGRQIKLSEMHTVYYEYVEKTRRYVRERGDFRFGQGSEDNAVIRVTKKYGAVPAHVYAGTKTGERYNHANMSAEVRNHLGYLKEHDFWDEEQAIEGVKLILNKYMGKPPESFEFEGATMTPHEFWDKAIGINLDDYVNVMSTLSIPFYSRGEYEVPDNWWHDSSYCNVPLDEWYEVIANAVRDGYTVGIGGDVSEPGYNGFEDAAIVPEFDIPQDYINQDSRELRFYNHSTGDDHIVHIVGYVKNGGRDWFLIKDSSRSGRWGKFEGYYFYRDDYVRLKMLDILVHKDAMQDLLDKCDAAPSGGKS